MWVVVFVLSAKKSLGQNFLKDEEVLKKIANSLSPSKADVLLEIGPGMGALTKYLVLKPSYYFAYEIDERMRPYLNKLTSHVIYKDFLKSDLLGDLRDIPYQNLYVMANIPYYITTPIIEKLVSLLDIQAMVLLVQKEVADRFSATPHHRDYGYFTVYLNHYFHVEMLFSVSRYAFSPAPNVDSAVVRFTKKEKVPLDEKKYFTFLKQCFSSKRKTLYNNLKSYDWNLIFPILQKYGYSSMVRAEEIPSEVFEEIFLSL